MSRQGSSLRFEKDPVVQQCRLLIDGYNLLFALGWTPVRKPRPSDSEVTLRQCRERLSAELAGSLPRSMVGKSVIVYDSANPRDGLPVHQVFRGTHLYFSIAYNSADEALQEILQYHPSPKQLVLISSDHAVQRKATARGARCIESEDWEDAIELFCDSESSSRLEKDMKTDSEKDIELEIKTQALQADEREDWLRRFGF